MSGPSNRSVYGRGIRDALPFVLVVGPFAFLFAVVSAEAGLNLLEIFSFSFIVVAGASQLAALSVLQDNGTALLAIFAGLAVNMRMAMYSASLTPWLGSLPPLRRMFAAYLMIDQTYALSITRYEQSPEWSLRTRLAYYLGTATTIMPVWYVTTTVGAVTGQSVPESLALDFAMPIAFLALIGPALRTAAHAAAALVSVVASLLLAGLPSGSGLLIAALLAMMTGAQVERWMERRRGTAA
ncbi:AzlC family ABC transporter permease [Pseudoroseicyclus tamaricis]|uniref:Branched-chain amino acid ABC transporter permease n=1 Tax=Pseudoroseicyclus tamaricis TaxID=2705421 RepID=A0A6B2JEU6_9RHOB|nr:AzlC family ABC transporter permease [Pseudoroseicyclus tamaricis]NDU99450.1 branched-chain amino acid ABC transporter permease [Pseudoroseicyclus tamaricis]